VIYFHRNLRFLIKASGKWAHDVAWELKIPRSTMYNYTLDHGKYASFENIKLIADYFRISADQLLYQNLESIQASESCGQ
jgi:hypothetical protein